MPHPDTRLGLWVETSVAGEKVRALVPPPLPPIPPVDLGTFSELIERANLALGRLDGVTSILPAPPLFIFMYVRKEALLSSQIEGTQSSLSDLLLFEADELPMVPLDDVEEVSNYIAALEYGLDRKRRDFRCRSGSSARTTASFSKRGVGPHPRLANLGTRRIGSAAHGQVMPCSSLHLPTN